MGVDAKFGVLEPCQRTGLVISVEALILAFSQSRPFIECPEVRQVTRLYPRARQIALMPKRTESPSHNIRLHP